MHTDNVSWLYSHIRKNKNSSPFFARSDIGGRVYLIAANRAARRMLMSKAIQAEAERMGAKIAVDAVTEGEAPVISIY